MGGHALKKVITVRKNKIEYNEIKDKVSNLLKSRGIIIDFIPELADKESFGDLDVLWSSSHNPNIIMKDDVIELFSPKEIVINGDVISFDLDDFQIDMIKCKTIEFAKFYFSYTFSMKLSILKLFFIFLIFVSSVFYLLFYNARFLASLSNLSSSI